MPIASTAYGTSAVLGNNIIGLATLTKLYRRNILRTRHVPQVTVFLFSFFPFSLFF